MVSLWGEYNRGPAGRRLFWSLGRAFTCFPNRQPPHHTANDHLFSLFAHHSISRLLALTYFLVHCLSFRSGNIATYMISTSSFLPSLKSYISLGPSFRIFVGIFALAERLPTSATLLKVYPTWLHHISSSNDRNHNNSIFHIQIFSAKQTQYLQKYINLTTFLLSSCDKRCNDISILFIM